MAALSLSLSLSLSFSRLSSLSEIWFEGIRVDGITGFYWVSIWIHRWLTGFWSERLEGDCYWVLLGFTGLLLGFYWVLLDGAWVYWVCDLSR